MEGLVETSDIKRGLANYLCPRWKIIPTTQAKKWKKESGRLQERTATDLRFESSTSAKVLLHRLRKILDGIQYHATKQEKKQKSQPKVCTNRS